MKYIRQNVTADDASVPTTGVKFSGRQLMTFYPTASATFEVFFKVAGTWFPVTPHTGAGPFEVEMPDTAEVTCKITGVTTSTDLFVK